MLNLALTPVSSSDLKSMRRSERIHQVRRPCSHGARLHKWQQQLLLMEQCSELQPCFVAWFSKGSWWLPSFLYVCFSESVYFMIQRFCTMAFVVCSWFQALTWLLWRTETWWHVALWKMTRKSLKKDAISCDLSAKYTWRMRLVAWSVTMHLWFQNLRVDSSDGSDWDFLDARKGANKI